MKKLIRCKRIIAVFLAVCLLVCCTTVAAEADTKSEFEQVTTMESATLLQAEDLPANIQALMPEGKENYSVYLQASEMKNGTYDDAELYTLRTENPATGKGVLTVHSAPIKYIDEKGELQFIDTDLQPTKGTRAEYSYRNTANSFTVEYGTNAATGINFDNVFTFAVKEKLASKNASTVSKTVRNAVVYDDAFGAHTAVEYVNIENGIKENIVLEKYTGQTRFEFVFRSETHIPILANDGMFIWIANKNTPKEPEYRFLSLYAYDSYDPAIHGTIKSSTFRHMNEELYYELTSNTDGSYTIAVVVPEEYLTHPEVVYPVTIDPSLTPYTSTNSNTQDTFVDASKPTVQTNYNLDYIRFGKVNGYKNFGYHRFASLPSPPSGANITSAKLKFTFRSGQTTPSASSGVSMWTPAVIAHQWNESTITWDNQPYGYSGPVTSITYNGSYLSYFNADLTDEVRGWYASPSSNYGIDFTYDNEEHNDYNSVVSSEGEAARAPVLNITYTLVLPSSVTLSSSNETLAVGATKKLVATVSPSNATDKSITWTTSNSAIATVNSSGNITAKKAGTATITATTINGKTAKCTVKVEKKWHVEIVEEPCVYTTVSAGIPIVVAYRVYVNAGVGIDQQTSSTSRRVSNVDSYTSLNTNSINPVLARPQLGIGVTSINGTQINMVEYTGAEIVPTDTMWDHKVATPNMAVGSSATFSSLAVCFQSDALIAYQDVEVSFTF